MKTKILRPSARGLRFLRNLQCLARTWSHSAASIGESKRSWPSVTKIEVRPRSNSGRWKRGIRSYNSNLSKLSSSARGHQQQLLMAPLLCPRLQLNSPTHARHSLCKRLRRLSLLATTAKLRIPTLMRPMPLQELMWPRTSRSQAAQKGLRVPLARRRAAAMAPTSLLARLAALPAEAGPTWMWTSQKRSCKSYLPALQKFKGNTVTWWRRMVDCAKFLLAQRLRAWW
mmetsp:Transcript_36265/g.83350  ORF Transcript_36265/g.83350 Transcript_36265/m.83350 type:complete len:228 (+) Transcript_36265:768-1451(+)